VGSYANCVKAWDEWAELTGRRYHPIETYRADDAEYCIVTMGSLGETAMAAVDELREQGEKVGVIKIRLWRPFPFEDLHRAVAGKSALIVLDRAISFGGPGGPVALEIRSAMCGKPQAPVIVDYVAGLASRDVRLEDFKAIILEGKAKAASGLAPAEGGIEEYFTGRPLPGPALPWVAVPTTAGTGAEVTPNAVLTDPGTRIKQSIRSDLLFARAAVIDPELTLALPPNQTTYSGMDALSHAIEAYVSKGANDLTDVFALEAARLIPANLLRAHEGGGLEARTALARASLLAGVALANARLGAVHGLAHPLGVYYDLPHGLVCAVLLPWVMRFNLQVAYEKFARLAEVWGVAPGGDVFDRAAAAVRRAR
ncbi:MAG: iron-containing alcohol dehydrogenase, partial [Firmicutes bacterium]|nr:iron-containing alcohol dehydrogenase [Bacillota bacterium]